MFLIFIAALFGGSPVVVDHGQPTGDLHHGDVLIERGVPSRAVCDDAGGWSITVDGTIWCLGEDF